MEQRHFWAYPHYEWERSPDGPLELLPGLVHTNAIEWAASAMEMSAIAAKNAANLLAAHFDKKSAPLPDAPPTTKDEL
jgi:Prenylcysteine lyase